MAREQYGLIFELVHTEYAGARFKSKLSTDDAATEQQNTRFGLHNIHQPNNGQHRCSNDLGPFHRDIDVEISQVPAHGRDIDSIESRSHLLHGHEREQGHAFTEKRSWPRRSVPSPHDTNISLAHVSTSKYRSNEERLYGPKIISHFSRLSRVSKLVLLWSTFMTIAALSLIISLFSRFRTQKIVRAGVKLSTTLIFISVAARLCAMNRTMVDTLIAMNMGIVYGIFLTGQIDGFFSNAEPCFHSFVVPMGH